MTSGNGLDGEPPDQGETRSAPAGEAKTFASGRYLVRRLLGEGAQKTVYLVRDMALERDCALSLIKTDVLDPDDVARFRREAQTMAGLTHGNIVTVHDISEEAEEGPYIVSEYVPGGDLQQELHEAGGPLPLRRAVGIAKDICRALSAAHEQGIIHRDLKPANIWLTKQGSAKLGDFGIAHSMERSRLTMPGTLMGTAAYMAPEQAEGRDVTERSDLYALGCLLYELLTGRPPFEGDDPMAVVSQHVHAQPVPPSEHGAALPEALERLVLRLLAKEPERRPASAEEVLAELERIEAALPATETVLPGRDVARRLKRLLARPAFRIVAAVLLLAAIGGGVVATVLLSEGGGETDVPMTTVAWTELFEGPGELVSGDCVADDLVSHNTIESVLTGDIVGTSVSTVETTFYVAQECSAGLVRTNQTLTDTYGNSLSLVHEGALSLSAQVELPPGFSFDPEEPLPGGFVDLATTLTGGSGIFEGATGRGSCTASFATEGLGGTSFLLRGRTECRLELSTAGSVEVDAPAIVQLALSETEVTIFAGTGGGADEATGVVLYRNTREEPQRNLSLRLLEPEGAQILAASVGEDNPIGGERVWNLPDLASGAIARFEFTIQFLSATEPTASIVLELDGDGFDEPVRSEPVILNVAQ